MSVQSKGPIGEAWMSQGDTMPVATLLAHALSNGIANIWQDQLLGLFTGWAKPGITLFRSVSDGTPGLSFDGNMDYEQSLLIYPWNLSTDDVIDVDVEDLVQNKFSFPLGSPGSTSFTYSANTLLGLRVLVYQRQADDIASVSVSYVRGDGTNSNTITEDFKCQGTRSGSTLIGELFVPAVEMWSKGKITSTAGSGQLEQVYNNGRCILWPQKFLDVSAGPVEGFGVNLGGENVDFTVYPVFYTLGNVRDFMAGKVLPLLGVDGGFKAI